MPSDPVIIRLEYRSFTAEECRVMKEVVDENPVECQVKWGTIGPDGKDSLKFLPIAELSTDHLENILITQPQASIPIKTIILKVLKKRYREECQISDIV